MNKKGTISIQAVGCKLNQAEAEKLTREFESKGYQVSTGKTADAFVINTCSVTQAADSKSRHLVRMLRKQNPGSFILVTGCYAEAAATILKKCGCDLVIGNHDKMKIPGMLDELMVPLNNNCLNIQSPQINRTRSFIKVQDGCRNHCTYCIVPLLRRDVVSIDENEVVADIKNRVADGYQEVVLTGTEIGSYKYNQYGLVDLLKLILDDTAIARLHLSSLQPQEITADLLNLWRNPRMVKHFHLALQSGSDRILQNMKRCYNTGVFFNAVRMIREAIPDAAITTDLIVGFPGETDKLFNDSYEFCRKVNFAAIHVFAYSQRAGTVAAGMKDQTGDSEKKERSIRMLELAAKSAERFAAGFIGQSRPVLWEHKLKSVTGIYPGLTDNYIRVYASSKKDLYNSIINARLITPANDTERILPRVKSKGNYGELWSELDEN